jgi:IS1 family transposase/uncharacterized protein YukE
MLRFIPFDINPPSVEKIRANFLIEKLNTVSQVGIVSPINIWSTGRTHSGKTTLGNLLFGNFNFMPSKGEQDCTDEINLIEFAGGLNYHDTPGVASKGDFENYNRAAFGIEPNPKFKPVKDLTLAKYSEKEGKTVVEREQFTSSEFQRKVFKPDLIFYVIAADKNFLDADCNYLGDLLTQHSQVIYVLNLFADTETGSLYATDENIIDMVNRITEVHQVVLGNDVKPIIVPVNCRTGEGINDLVKHSYQVLGNKKGQLFKELIEYQQQKTPEEYIKQVKHKLLQFYAYGACQKPESRYTCDQTFHETCSALLDFLAKLNIHSQQTSKFLETQRLVHEIINTPQKYSQKSPKSRRNQKYSAEVGLCLIDERIDAVNAMINSYLVQAEQETIELRNYVIDCLEEKDNSLKRDILSLELEKMLVQEQAKPIVEKFLSLRQEIESQQKILQPRIDEFNRNNSKLKSRIIDYNFRRQQLNLRIQNYNKAVAECNARFFPPSSLTDFIRREDSAIDSEQSLLDRESDSLDAAISSNTRESQSLDREIAAINEMERQVLELFNKLEETKLKIRDIQRTRLQRDKIYEDFIQYSNNLIEKFAQDFNQVNSEIKRQINSIQSSVSNINNRFQFQDLENEFFDDHDKFLEEINTCIEQINSFQNQISFLVVNLNFCATRMLINSAVADIFLLSTTHLFDNTDELTYRGVTYQKCGKNGLMLLLVNTHLFVLSNIMENHNIEQKLAPKFDIFDDFTDDLTESQIYEILQSKINLMFLPEIEQIIKTSIAI